ncbi:MAG: valine--tRNA ligase [Gammaproteobacteria bacterium]|nr:valine--tRNA ligase [Gammaproteobacteria bacterium]
MDKSYNPAAIEQRIYAQWEASGAFGPHGDGQPYCIMIPPPNVTGTLHMGHAFQDTVMDLLTRYHRMRGRQTLWQPGTDHAGIATQMVVERQLEAQGSSRHDLGREKFVEKVWEWKAESGDTISQQLRRLGASVDWKRERFTMDDGLSEAVREVFVRLYDEGLIYRGKRLVNWDPVLHTALSDLEVLAAEEQGQIWHLRYPLAPPDPGDSGNASPADPDYLIVATTRPETMLGDTAVAIHPDDERFRHLVGRQVELPLTGRRIPVIADDYVDPEFGSGCVKITPAHDFNDYEIGRRHDLPMINILTDNADINEAAPPAYQGLSREAARRQIVADLDALGLVDEIKDHRLMVPRGDRSGAIVEPYLTDQWYVKIEPLATPAIAAVESGRIRFVPENWDKTYFEWMRNIQDWCISRQLWWGHRIPAWYDDDDNIYVGHDLAAIRAKYELGDEINLRQDEDVLDTWFSSALWPFSTLGWPAKTDALKTFYPTTVLVTGFDIIFFWVARMIMMGLKFMGDVPFHEVYIHGLVKDEAGQKMSKSKGNVLDPLDLIDSVDLETLVKKRTSSMMQEHLQKSVEKSTRRQFPDGIPAFGTDALRFTFASLATHGRDIRFDLARVEGYRNFCNKLWNAARYVLMNTAVEVSPPAPAHMGLADRWIMSRLAATVDNVCDNIDSYRFDLASHTLYEFIWHEYCDWYLELTKPVLQDDSDPSAANAARHTLVSVLEAILRLSHPVMPFITEEIWQRVAPVLNKTEQSIMACSYPAATEWPVDPVAEADLEWVKSFIVGVRNIRGEMDVSPSRPLPVLIQNADEKDRERLTSTDQLLRSLARLERIELLQDEPPPAATALVGRMKVLVPMAGAIDPKAEIERLSRKVEKQRKELRQNRNKLENDKFVRNAPEAVVNKARELVTELEGSINQLEQQIELVKSL